MSNAYDYQEDPELSGQFVTMGEGAAVDRYNDEPTARIVVRPPSVVANPDYRERQLELPEVAPDRLQRPAPYYGSEAPKAAQQAVQAVPEFLGLPDAYRALQGTMTETEAKDFAAQAAMGLLPMKGVGKAAKGVSRVIGSLAETERAPVMGSLVGHNGPPSSALDFWGDLPRDDQVARALILPGDKRVSTRFPTSVSPSHDPLRQHLSVGLQDMLQHSTPEQLAHNMGLVAKYPGMGHLAEMAPEEAARAYVDQAQKNLRFVYDNAPPSMQQRSPFWYEGANRFTDALANRYGVPRQSASGGTAVLSPQKDWFQNASLSERTGDIIMGPNRKWDSEMLAFARQNDALSNKENAAIVRRIMGKSLDQIDDPLEKAVWVRLWDEVHNPRHYRSITPEGDLGGYVRNDDGSLAKVGWGSGGEIAKAIQMYQSGGEMDTISRLLGNKHKVRSFYNNVELPNDPRFGDVTSDTHQVASALLRPLSGNTAEVAHNFGSSLAKKHQPPGYQGTMNSSLTGLQGTYPLNVEATRGFAREVGMVPRAGQSTVWEPVRELFTDTFKSNPKNVAAIDDIWRAYDRKELTLEQAQRAILKRAGGIGEPSWARSSDPTHAPSQASTYR
jgi:hypothetical protein